MADAAGEEVDNEINLEQLKLLKAIFEDADEDGSGELDIDEFCVKLGPHLGVNLKRQQVAQLFMKIDADAGGTVDWDEFTNFMFLEKAQAGAGENDADNWRLFPADFRDKNGMSGMHREQVDKVYFCAAIDKYITCARDGTFRLWQAADLDYVKTVNDGSSWITDCLYLPQSRKMVFTTMDRAITYYDITRGSYDLIGRVYASGAMGVPLSLHVLSGDAGERVVYGDSKGAAVLLLCGSRELPPRDLISTDTHKDYIYLHKEHYDWVTKIQWISELGLVTSSLDTTIKTFDINRERIIHTCTHHTKGVHSFVWCPAYSCFASCGLERDVTVWHGSSGRKVGELRGHTSSVSHIALDPVHNHIFTLGVDNSIKVWDLRNHRCLQTITQVDWVRQSDSAPTCMMYDSTRCRLVTACHRPYIWQHKAITQDRTGHKDPVRGALYNAAFAVVVSVDETGTTCVWNLQDGARGGRFTTDAVLNSSQGRKHSKDLDQDVSGPGTTCVTAISFDKNQRRLVMGTNSGAVTAWNFNNGSLLRRFSHDQEPLEICEVLLAWDDKRGGDVVYAAGWNAKVFVWEDQDEDIVDSYKTLEGHRSDILAMAAYAPRQLLATADYQGRIQIWGVFTGERKSWVTYRSPFSSKCSSSLCDTSHFHSLGGTKGTSKADLGLYSGCGASTAECSVERVVWVPAFSPQQRQAAAAAAAALISSAPSLTAVSSNPLKSSTAAHCGSPIPEGRSSSSAQGGVGQQQSQSAWRQHSSGLAVGSSMASLLSDASLNNITTHQQQQQHQQQHSMLAAKQGTDGLQASASGSGGLLEDHTLEQQQQQQQQQQQDVDVFLRRSDSPDSLLLLAAGGDSGVLVWHIDRLAQPTALCSLPGAVSRHEVITAAGMDEAATVVVMGDSAGHLRVLDISDGVDTTTSAAAAASFKQRALWQAHDRAITSVDIIPARPRPQTTSGHGGDDVSSPAAGSCSGSSQPLILTSSRDCNVALWTLDGGLVGVFGDNSWDLDNQGTWQDPHGKNKRPPQEATEADSDEVISLERRSTAGSRDIVTAGCSSPLGETRELTTGGMLQGHVGSGTHTATTGIHSSAAPHQQSSLQPPSADLKALSLASVIMQERKQKLRDAMVTCSPQPHCQLVVHPLADIEADAALHMHASRTAKQHQHRSSNRAAGLRSQYLGNRQSGTSSWSGWTGS